MVADPGGDVPVPDPTTGKTGSVSDSHETPNPDPTLESTWIRIRNPADKCMIKSCFHQRERERMRERESVASSQEILHLSYLTTLLVLTILHKRKSFFCIIT